MEYLPNLDLKLYIKKMHNNNPDIQFSELLCSYFMSQIIDALSYMKNQNILHRDIKLENIMLSKDYQIKVGDFSLSKRIDKKSKFITTRSGTLPYLAPECVIKKNELSSSSCFKIDIFSLGIVMYWMIFNCHPFDYKVKLILILFRVV